MWEVESQTPWEDELVVTLAIYLVQAPLNRGGESSPKGHSQGHIARVIQPGRSRARLSSDVLSLLGISYKGSHPTDLAALEVSGSKETLWLMNAN